MEETDTACDLTTEYQFDSAGRMVTMIAYNAKGDDNDPNHVNVQEQATKYLYESLVNPSWQTAVVYPESADSISRNADGDWVIASGTDHVSTAYDLLGRVIVTTDQRGVMHSYTFDTAGRLSADVVANTATALEAIGVDSDILSIGRQYDDLGRLAKLTSYHDAAGTSVANEVAYRFDGWGNVAQEWQAHEGAVDNDGLDNDDTASIQYVYCDGLTENATIEAASYVRLENIVYPNGRTLHFGYGQAGHADDIIDEVLSRADTIGTVTGEGQNQTEDIHAQFTYLGAGMIASETFNEPGVQLDYGSNLAGLDRFGRVVDQVWKELGESGQTLDEYLYGYDRTGNRSYRQNGVAHVAGKNLDELYTYDAVDQLLTARRGQLTTDHTGFETGTEQFAQNWALDALGNMSGLQETTDGTLTLDQARAANAANEIDVDNNHANAAGASITASTGTNWYDPTYDAAGNTITAPNPGALSTGLTLKYDAWNRTKEVSRIDGQQTVLLGRYEYDGQSRRILKYTPASGTADARYEHFYLNGQQVIETRELATSAAPTDTAVKYQFVNSLRYIDALILRDQYSAGTIESGSRLFYLSDANYNVTGLVNVSGEAIERYAYDAYGKTLYFNGSWTALTASAFNNTNLYTGRTLDLETGLFYYRTRLYDVNLMRFLGRDPIGYSSGMDLYSFVSDNPIDFVDPFGLQTTKGKPNPWDVPSNPTERKPNASSRDYAYWHTEDWKFADGQVYTVRVISHCSIVVELSHLPVVFQARNFPSLVRDPNDGCGAGRFGTLHCWSGAIRGGNPGDISDWPGAKAMGPIGVGGGLTEYWTKEARKYNLSLRPEDVNAGMKASPEAFSRLLQMSWGAAIRQGETMLNTKEKVPESANYPNRLVERQCCDTVWVVFHCISDTATKYAGVYNPDTPKGGNGYCNRGLRLTMKDGKVSTWSFVANFGGRN